jgi:hypothetical protein
VSSSSSSSASSPSSSASSEVAAALHQTSSFTEQSCGGGHECGGQPRGAEEGRGLLGTPLSASASSLYATPNASMSLLLLSACSLDTCSALDNEDNAPLTPVQPDAAARKQLPAHSKVRTLLGFDFRDLFI